MRTVLVSFGMLLTFMGLMGLLKKSCFVEEKDVCSSAKCAVYYIPTKSPKQTNVQFTMKYEQEQILSKELLIYVFILD